MFQKWHVAARTSPDFLPAVNALERDGQRQYMHGCTARLSSSREMTIPGKVATPYRRITHSITTAMYCFMYDSVKVRHSFPISLDSITSVLVGMMDVM